MVLLISDADRIYIRSLPALPSLRARVHDLLPDCLSRRMMKLLFFGSFFVVPQTSLADWDANRGCSWNHTPECDLSNLSLHHV